LGFLESDAGYLVAVTAVPAQCGPSELLGMMVDEK
jgi:hypothetical protein